MRNPIAPGLSPSSGGERDATIPLGRVTHQSQAPQEDGDRFVDGHSGFVVGSGHLLRTVGREAACTVASHLIRGDFLPAMVPTGAGFGSPPSIEAGVGPSHSAAALGDPVRLDARLPIVLKFCRSAATVRLRIAPVPAVLCVSAGPAKGSVFQKVKQVVRCLFHALNLASVRDADHGRFGQERG